MIEMHTFTIKREGRMKKTILVLLASMLVITTAQAYAGNGDLIVGGNMGVGAATPELPLHIRKQNSAISLDSTGSGSVKWWIYPTDAANGQGPGKLLFYRPGVDGAGSAAAIDGNSGNFGIGTASPGARLHLLGNGTWTDGLRLQYSGSSIPWNLAQGQDSSLWFGYGENAKMVMFNNGYVGIGTPSPNSALHVNGTITGTSKNFDIKDPRYSDPRKRLIHSTLEGPEIGVYYRGEAKLEKGKATITLPPYFEALTRKENRTVVLTPKFDNDDDVLCNLAASDVKNGVFIIKAVGVPDPLLCNHKAFWEVKAERSDIDRLEVEQSREDYPEMEKRPERKDKSPSK